LQSSSFHRKRTFQPKVDLHTNPQCMERQLTDSYELKRLNRNPQLYTLTQADLQRSSPVAAAAVCVAYPTACRWRLQVRVHHEG
jgi:hypothetical protein